MALALAAVCLGSAVVSDTKCPILGNSCGGNATCCPNYWSPNGYGCCPGGTELTCCFTQKTPNNLWPPQSTYCCPKDYKCNATGPFSGECIAPSIGAVTFNESHLPLDVIGGCKAGVGKMPMVKDKPNVLVLGDSVSIGYTVFLSVMTRDVASTQHTPWDETDGGAGATDEGLNCLDFWLRNLDYELLDPPPNVIMWNFGIHNTPVGHVNATQAIANYTRDLGTLAKRIQGMYPTIKQAFVLTTPIPYNKTQDDYMVLFNKIASDVMKENSIAVIDLYSPVIEKCGPTPYYDCPIALNTKTSPNPHYNPDGYIYLVNGTLAPALKGLLH